MVNSWRSQWMNFVRQQQAMTYFFLVLRGKDQCNQQHAGVTIDTAFDSLTNGPLTRTGRAILDFFKSKCNEWPFAHDPAVRLQFEEHHLQANQRRRHQLALVEITLKRTV